MYSLPRYVDSDVIFLMSQKTRLDKMNEYLQTLTDQIEDIECDHYFDIPSKEHFIQEAHLLVHRWTIRNKESFNYNDILVHIPKLGDIFSELSADLITYLSENVVPTWVYDSAVQNNFNKVLKKILFKYALYITYKRNVTD